MESVAKFMRKCTSKAEVRRALATLPAALLLSGVLGLPLSARACTELPAGTSFWVRLTTPVNSYTAKAGMPVEGFLLESPECENAPVFPMKVPVQGRVVSAHRVGLGLWHETAAIELSFDRLLPEGAAAIEIKGQVKVVDNAREEVKNGVVRGIRSTDTPQGRISSRLKYLPSLHLYPDPFLLGYKMLFPVFPEPEILLEPGTDVQVELTHVAALPADLAPVQPAPELDHVAELSTQLTGLPERTVTSKGKTADVVNVVFEGSRENLEHAFQAAGWKESEPVSKRAVMHQMYAFLAKTNYSTAPMSAQLLEGRRPDLTLEKTFDSYEKRNHLRIWAMGNTFDGQALWVSAAVRETGATLSVRHKGFIHHVSQDLAEEQRMVVRDLMAAGCLDSLGTIARPDMDHVMQNATGDLFRTDGSLTVVRIKPCAPDSQAAGFSNEPRPKPGSWAFRYTRRQILTVRSDLWRANCIYSLFDLTRMTVKALRANSSHRAEVAAFRQETSAPAPEDIKAFPSEEVPGP